jgi:broad specificity phosphatase PhoE
MKLVTFLRHGSLAAPYEPYDGISLETLSDIGMNRIEPDIDVEQAKERIAAWRRDHTETIDALYASTAPRARQTAEIFAKAAGVRPESIDYSDAFSEILFDPAVLTTSEAFAQEKMDAIRSAFFPAMLSGKGADTLEETFVRIGRVETQLHEAEGERIVCITHGFYMRLLKLHFVDGKDLKDVTAEDFESTPSPDFLTGFDVKL